MRIHHQAVDECLVDAQPSHYNLSLVVVTSTGGHTGFGTLKLGDLMSGTREAASYCVWAWTIINFMIYALTREGGLTLLGHHRCATQLYTICREIIEVKKKVLVHQYWSSSRLERSLSLSE